MDKIGFCLCLVGLGGLAESYGEHKAFAISLILIIAGSLLILAGDMKNDIQNYKRSNNDHSRPYFLP